MASGNSAQSAARQYNIAFQFSFFQRNITINPQKSSNPEREHISLRIQACEEIIQRDADLMARYTGRIYSLVRGHPPIDSDTLEDPNHLLFIAKRMLEALERKKREYQLIGPLQVAGVQVYVDKLTKLLLWLEALIKLQSS
ncbi:hypothetical protein CCMA1212_007757 [Trichoderma ghanense]|uniref:Uncharacterized protein n=1 Tax=Trichoderma ghanense TaxID=65468 RepID=A0ABY2GXK2_9HYPO